jgi:hypothetical protein
MSFVGVLRSRVLVAFILLAFVVGVAMFMLGFAYLTMCACGRIQDVPEPEAMLIKAGV